MQFHFPILVIWLKSAPLLASIWERSDEKRNRKSIAISKFIASDNGILLTRNMRKQRSSDTIECLWWTFLKNSNAPDTAVRFVKQRLRGTLTPKHVLHFFIYCFTFLSKFLVSWEMYGCDLILQNFSHANWIKELKEYLI